MDLGSKINVLRKEKGWSQSELARKIEVFREIVGRYERNDAIPSIDIAKRMADTFEISLDYLVGNTDTHFGWVQEKPFFIRKPE